MILTRTPLRISFVGGGSDRPSFYNEEPGACVAAAIDKYIYVAVNPKYDGSIRAAYSITENVTHQKDIKHDIIRNALKIVGRPSGIEIHSIADIPAGTGLGSSSSFTVGLLAALDANENSDPGNAQWLARKACDIEIDMCHKPIGKQDQYTAAFGGINLLVFTSKGVTVNPIECDIDRLSAHCLLLDTGLARQGDAGAVLAAQQQDRDDVRQLVGLAKEFAGALIGHSDMPLCGELMHEAWLIKSKFIGIGIRSDWNIALNAMYAVARLNGAWGGKLCGAGGGGFMLFLAPPDRHQSITQALGLRHVPIQLGVPGSEVVWQAH